MVFDYLYDVDNPANSFKIMSLNRQLPQEVLNYLNDKDRYFMRCHYSKLKGMGQCIPHIRKVMASLIISGFSHTNTDLSLEHSAELPTASPQFNLSSRFWPNLRFARLEWDQNVCFREPFGAAEHDAARPLITARRIARLASIKQLCRRQDLQDFALGRENVCARCLQDGVADTLLEEVGGRIYDVVTG